MAPTSRGNRYPGGTDPVDPDGDVRHLAEDLNLAALYDEVASADRLPARGDRIGHHIRVVATNVVYVWNGTAWIALTRGLNPDGAADEATIRTLGAGARQAASGADPRFSDQRVPIDGSVTLAKVSTGLLLTASTVNSDPVLRPIGTGRGEVAAGADVQALATSVAAVDSAARAVAGMWTPLVSVSGYLDSAFTVPDSFVFTTRGFLWPVGSSGGGATAAPIWVFSPMAAGLITPPAGYTGVEYRAALHWAGPNGSPTGLIMGLKIAKLTANDVTPPTFVDTALDSGLDVRVKRGDYFATSAGPLAVGSASTLIVTVGSTATGRIHASGGMNVGAIVLYRFVR